MRWLAARVSQIVALGAALGLGVVGTAGAVSPSVAAPAPMPEAARVLWLDKQTNGRQEVVLMPAMAQALGPLALRLERCVADLHGQPGTDAAWLVVSEPARGTEWFSGWMINTLPEVATLDHPRFDVQLQGCGSEPRPRVGPVARSGKPVDTGVDMESSVSPSAAEAFVVPGIADSSAALSPTVASPDIIPDVAAPPAPALPAPAEAAPDSTAQEALHQFIDSLPREGGTE